MIKHFLIFAFCIIIISIAGCFNVKSIEKMNYNDYMSKIKNDNYNSFSIIITVPDKDINYGPNWRGIISNTEYEYSISNAQLIRKFLLENSSFIGKINDNSPWECGYRVAIELLHKRSIKKLRIIATDVGFSFDGYAPRTNRVFLNDKLKHWLIKQLNLAGFPKNAAMIDKCLPSQKKRDTRRSEYDGAPYTNK